MQVHRDLYQLPDFNDAVITIGSFDGVHAGHRQIIKRLTAKAKDINGQSVIITFFPHPRIILDPIGHSVTLLNSLQEKIQLLEALGVDHVVVVPFDKKFSQLSPTAYIEDFLLEKFNPRVIIIGYDHKFGNDRSGDITMLQKYQSEHKFELIEIEKHLVDNIGVSSTKIRRALAANQIQKANSLLSYPYILSGTVAKGDQIGRSMGFPTANLKIDESHKLIPPDGIYAAQALIDNQAYEGMLYIGDRPTINNEKEKVIEINLFDFDQDIYNRDIQIKVFKFIRSDSSYNSMEELKEQIYQDQQSVQSYFSTTRSVSHKCAVAVLNYNGLELLKKYVPELIKHTPEADIIVIDNKSTDDSIQYLKSLETHIKIIALNKNYGFAEGYNQAIKQLSNYPYVLLLNSDVRVTENWLTPLITAMESDQGIASVQPKIRAENKPDHFEYAGASGGFIDRWGFPYCRGRIFDAVEQDHGQYDSPTEIHWCSGAAMLIRTSLYIESGGLDKDFFAHQEEIDLCWRLRSAGYRLMVIPSSTIYHVGGATLSYSSPRKLFLNYRNNITTMIKNSPTSTLFWLVPWRFALDKVSGFKFLLGGDFKSFKAVSKALIFEFFNYPLLLKKRRQVQETIKKLKHNNKHTQHPLPHTPNIIIPYFIKKIKKFSDL